MEGSSLKLPHSRTEEEKQDRKWERKLLTRELDPSCRDFEQDFRDSQAHKRNRIIADLVHSEMVKRAMQMAECIQRAFTEARCSARVDVNWAAFGKVPADFATDLTRVQVLPEGPIAIVLKAKATYQPGKEHRPRRPKVVARDGTVSTSQAKPEQVEVIELRPLYFAKHAWSAWRYTIAGQQVVFTWTELPQRQAEFQPEYPTDWTWFPTLKSADNREKMTVVSWKTGVPQSETRFATHLNAAATVASLQRANVVEARKVLIVALGISDFAQNARRRVPVGDEEESDGE